MTPAIAALDLRHGRWARVFVATVRLPGGEAALRDVEDHGRAVAVPPYDPERRVALLVRRFRAPPFHAAGEADTLELPAGRLEGEDPAACARREAMEEAGLRLGELEPVLTAWTMPALSTERAHLFFAPCGAPDRVGAGGGLASKHEGITVAETPLAELVAMADAGTPTEPKLFALVQALRLRCPELFAAP